MSAPDQAKIHVKSYKRLFDGFYKVDELIFDHPTFEGEMIEDVRREIFVRKDAVAVLPYDPVTDQVLLIRQLRIAAIGHTEHPWVVELIAGLIDKAGEDVKDVAVREAYEEAGLSLTHLRHIGEFFPSVGGSNEYMYLFAAVCDLSAAGGYYGLCEEKEDIEAFVISRTEAMNRLNNGEIQTASTIIALQWLALNYQSYQK
ncbi:NUDIX domain-containing protein [Wohlfahrtiimonas chitiniclastica]|uniref:NUDIX domain-containing protein n=1 Tax=Wohlfahrtiimonas chitiniclastica TaxID=400946 RepID=UPI000377E84D|nr:NUDIX domain-containing protein [Wohlfahrtiimonas chitiniclastica]